jgi:hypothetical protein
MLAPHCMAERGDTLASPPPLAGEVGRRSDSEGGREGEFFFGNAPSPSLPRKRGREHGAAAPIFDPNAVMDYAV